MTELGKYSSDAAAAVSRPKLTKEAQMQRDCLSQCLLILVHAKPALQCTSGMQFPCPAAQDGLGALSSQSQPDQGTASMDQDS